MRQNLDDAAFFFSRFAFIVKVVAAAVNQTQWLRLSSKNSL